MAEPAPFPVDRWPAPLRAYVEHYTALGHDPSYLAGAMVAVLAGCMGQAPRLRILPGWSERAIVWMILVGPPDTGKTHPIDAAMEPLYELQEQRRQRYVDEHTAWAAHPAKRGEPREPEPTFHDAFLDDTTMELLARQLGIDPTLMVRSDELAGFLGRLGAYNKREGTDRARLLELGTGIKLFTYRRVTAPQPYLSTEPTVSILGGLQPHKLDLLGDASDALCGRWLMVSRTQRHPFVPVSTLNGSDTLDTTERVAHGWLQLGRQLIRDRQTSRSWHLGLDALTAFDDARHMLYDLGNRPERDPSFREWIRKSDYWIARLALIDAEIHRVIDHQPADASPLLISAATVATAAAQLAHYIDHRRRCWVAQTDLTVRGPYRSDQEATDALRRALDQAPDGRLTGRDLRNIGVAGCRESGRRSDLVERFSREWPGFARVERSPNGREVWVLYRPGPETPNGTPAGWSVVETPNADELAE